MINFKTIPFLKILLPYVLGIVCAIQFGIFNSLHLVCLIIGLCLAAAFLHLKFSKKPGYFQKALYLFFVNVFLFFFAFESCYLFNDKNNPSHYTRFLSNQIQSFVVEIEDLPVVSQKQTKLAVNINAIQFKGHWHYVTGHTIVYLKSDSLKQLSLGNKLLIHAKFSYINQPKNPQEFDYKSFLERKNIFHTVFANMNSVYSISNQENISWEKLGTLLKSKLVSVLRTSGLSQEAFSICSALLVGYDDEIEGDIMKSFSHSGTLHVLSVSGMHTGVLYAFLIFLFSLVDKHDQYQKTKLWFVLVCLWAFVLITGLSPSILRAALMLSLVLLGKTFYKQGNSYNTLLLSAFLLLLYNPYLIMDVGFLLSYFAVLGIMYLYPILQSKYVFNNKILQSLWSGTLVSFSATLFTLPISLYFFHQFPIWFLISNMVIIPISIALMTSAAALVVVYKLLFLKKWLVILINMLTSLMLWFAKLTDDNNYGYIDFISFSKVDFILLSICIFLGILVITYKNYKHVVFLCSVMIAWLSLSIYTNYLSFNKKELLVFHVKHQSCFAVRIGNCVYGNFKDLNTNDFERSMKPYLYTIPNLKLVPNNNFLFKTDSLSVMRVSNKSNNNSNIIANYVIVSQNTPIYLTTNHNSKQVIIADCSNSYKFVKKLKIQCARLNLPFYSVKESGAFRVNL